ncbi:Ig-like domain-containing protein [Lentilactobacillus farraginis]|uniref:Bacterial Ig domain-containing protein n=1 Tax=Lentilactobacillus farraginis DSM 18382 = JCM 14108 TaxID=1423743 RepID=X0PBJ5_9LACO|nr:Ig-like domain-containing protein [Lentilactobacillus farraginis]KRM10330.1 hypothetical protein FD41_GL002127 [Lentilactobacillus farraginis DSM 18382 = JCM 14108]GAF37283.1 hypothetical protein JCM14108_2302 [Lentilactobacillus farraginis DSM 18382 = JCM 14108]
MKKLTRLLGMGLGLPFIFAATASANYYNPGNLKLTIKPVNNSQTKITGTATRGSLVNFYQDGDLKAKAKVSSSGKFTIPLKYALSHVGSYKLTATKFNYKPVSQSFKVTMYPYTAQIKPIQDQINTLQNQLNAIQSQLSTMQSTADGLTNNDTSSADYQRAFTAAGSNPQAFQATYLGLEQQSIELQNQIAPLQAQIQHYQDLSNR